MIHVTAHAIERYIERVANVSHDQARQKLTSPFIIAAALFGAPYVRLGTGQHVVIEDRTIITVLPADHWVGSFDRARDATGRQSRQTMVRPRNNPDLRCAGSQSENRGY